MPKWNVTLRSYKILDFHHGVISDETETSQVVVDAPDAQSAAEEVRSRNLYTFAGIDDVQEVKEESS